MCDKSEYRNPTAHFHPKNAPEIGKSGFAILFDSLSQVGKVADNLQCWFFVGFWNWKPTPLCCMRNEENKEHCTILSEQSLILWCVYYIMIGESFQPKIADPLRNESIEITCRYAHVFPSTQKEVASKLDDMMADIQASD